MRKLSELRALCARARRPMLRLMVGLGLLVPAAGFMASARVEPLVEDTAGAEVQAQAKDVVAEAWKQEALSRERDRLTSQFADRFRISEELAAEIHVAALEAEIPPALAFGLVRAESSFRTRAVSPVGAIGLTQLMPSTAKWLEPNIPTNQLFDTRTNLRVGFNYLRKLLDQYDGNERLALTAYNRGPGTVNRLLRSGRNPDNGYAQFVSKGESAKHVRLMRAKFGT
jgi:soluble lytic murein transglycosylase-like protein